jgi:hypothetical protein
VFLHYRITTERVQLIGRSCHGGANEKLDGWNFRGRGVMIPVRETFTRLLKYPLWRRAGRDLESDEIEYLAQSVVDYARMRLDLNPDEMVVVEVDELAFRFREDRRVIGKVLCVLESQGRAEKTKLNGLWRLMG